VIGSLDSRSRVPTKLGLSARRSPDGLHTTAATLLLAKAQMAETVAASLIPPDPGLVTHIVSESAIEVLQKAVAPLEIGLLPAPIRSSPVCVTFCARVYVHPLPRVVALKPNVGPMAQRHAQWLS
jgi:hypothetical protein